MSLPARSASAGVGGDVPKEPAMSEPVLQNKTKTITVDFLANGHKKVAVLHIEDLNSPQLLSTVVSTMVTYVVVRKEVDQCRAIGGLLAYSLFGGYISLDQMVDGFARVFEDAPDLAYAVPQVYDLLAVILVPLVLVTDLFAEPIADACIKHLHSVGKATTMMANLINAIVKEKRAERKFPLEITLRQLIAMDPSPDEVGVWIEGKFGDHRTEGFATQLTTALANEFIEGLRHKYKVLGNALEIFLEEKRICLYFATPELQFAALQALEQVSASYEHPQRLLDDLFNSFYASSVCDDEAYYQWEKMATANVDLHRTAIAGTALFFEFLRIDGADPEA